jgi:hypothetical protein
MVGKNISKPTVEKEPSPTSLTKNSESFLHIEEDAKTKIKLLKYCVARNGGFYP